MKSKKADGMSLNLVVVAVLALVVLVVILAVFGGKMRDTNTKGDAAQSSFMNNICEQNGKKCIANGTSGCNNRQISNDNKYIDCPSPNCCQ